MQLKFFLLILENEGEERMIFKKLKNVAILNTWLSFLSFFLWTEWSSEREAETEL